MKRTYRSIIFITILWIISALIVLSMSSCSGANPREVIFRAKVINYSPITSSFYPSTSIYLITVDSAYRPTDTVIWNNERYILLERSK